MNISTIQITEFQKIYQFWKIAGLNLKPKNIEKYEFEEIIKLNADSCYVAKNIDEVIGTIFGTYNGRRAWIYHIAVHPRFQKQGIGSQLMKKCESALKRRGAHKIIIGVAYENIEIMPFYLSNNFTTMNDAILMTKDI